MDSTSLLKMGLKTRSTFWKLTEIFHTEIYRILMYFQKSKFQLFATTWEKRKKKKKKNERKKRVFRIKTLKEKILGGSGQAREPVSSEKHHSNYLIVPPYTVSIRVTKRNSTEELLKADSGYFRDNPRLFRARIMFLQSLCAQPVFCWLFPQISPLCMLCNEQSAWPARLPQQTFFFFLIWATAFFLLENF